MPAPMPANTNGDGEPRPMPMPTRGLVLRADPTGFCIVSYRLMGMGTVLVSQQQLWGAQPHPACPSVREALPSPVQHKPQAKKRPGFIKVIQ